MTDPYNPKIDRREAITRLSAAAIAAGAVVGGAGFFLERRSFSDEARTVPDWRVAVPDGAPAVVATRGGEGPRQRVRRALAAFGGISAFVGAGHTVVIKPNVGWDRLPQQAANTDPDVVGELVAQCVAAGAKRVVVTDNTCNDPRRCFARSGIAEATRAAGGEVIESQKLEYVPVQMGGLLSGLHVADVVLRADRVINVPVVKHHSLSRATLGMKNWFGVLGDGRNRLHQGIHRAVAELGAVFRPTLTVVDATRVLMRNGPTGGSLADVREAGALAIGIDPVLCDAWGAVELGADPARLPFLTEATQRGLGRTDLALVEQVEVGAA